MSETTYFTKDNGVKLPVSDKFLLPFLNPTSPGTQYWQSPPAGAIADRQQGRILLQIHQILGLMAQMNISLEGRSMLDIGTGNGMVPRLLLEFSDLSSAVGADPFLDGEHTSSWQQHDQDEIFRNLRDFIHEHCPNEIDYNSYGKLTGYEHFSLRPITVKYEKPREAKQYRFAQVGAHNLEDIGETFDFIYAKCIDHIPDWEKIFSSVSTVADKNAVFYIKHFSFFSFLGPHRYATTNIPWGHLLMTDDEYKRFAEEFHTDRADKMTKFYFKGLAYPRNPMNNLIKMARDHGFIPKLVINEPLRNVKELYHLADSIPNFWSLVRENYPEVSAEEMFSGRYHIVLEKIS